jgi:hypothetical protein
MGDSGVPSSHLAAMGEQEEHSDGDMELGTMAVPSPRLARPMHRRTSSKSALVSDFSSGKEEVRTQFASVSCYCCLVLLQTSSYTFLCFAFVRFVRSFFIMRDIPKNVVHKIPLYIRVHCSAVRRGQPTVRRISFRPLQQKIVFKLPNTAFMWYPLALFLRHMAPDLRQSNIVYKKFR